MQIAVYPGSFDPLTNGHVDVIERAATLFDKVIVGVGVNSGKKPFLPVDLRLACIRDCVSDLHNVEVLSFNGLLTEFCQQEDATVIVRGLRATSDFDYEFQIAMANRRLAPELETVCLMTKWDHSYLSSSIVREVALLNGDFSSFVPSCVHQAVLKFLAQS